MSNPYDNIIEGFRNYIKPENIFSSIDSNEYHLRTKLTRLDNCGDYNDGHPSEPDDIAKFLVNGNSLNNDDDYQNKMLGEDPIFPNIIQRDTAESTVTKPTEEFSANSNPDLFQESTGDRIYPSYEHARQNNIEIISSGTDAPQKHEITASTKSQLLEYLSILCGPSKDQVLQIWVSEESEAGFKLRMEFQWAGSPVSFLSSPEVRREKLYHNFDKNILEFFTTVKFLQKSRPSADLERKLRQIYTPSGGKYKLKEFERNNYWKVLENENTDIISYLRAQIYSKYFEEYLLEKFIENKLKKFQEKKIDPLVKSMMKEKEYQKLATSTEEEFVNTIREILKANDIQIAQIAGEAVEEAFLKKVHSRIHPFFCSHKGTAGDLKQMLQKLFKEVIIEANLCKVLWMLANKGEFFQLTERLAKTRIITHYLKENSKNSEDNQREEEEEEWSDVEEPRAKKIVKKKCESIEFS